MNTLPAVRRFLPATLSLLALAAWGPAPSASAGPHVPEVTVDQLPVAGTCAPLPQSHATWVTIGETGWFRIDRDPRDVDGRELKTLLKARGMFASQAGQPHDVWILARGDRDWGQVVNVLGACQEAGIHRVGLEVRSEATGEVCGFPLFLPYAAPAAEGSAPPGTARRLEVRVNAASEAASNPKRLYAAAKTAVDRFGPVVAELSLSVRTRIQDAVTAVDMLYRAGCAAVRHKFRSMVRSLSGETHPRIYVEEALLPSEPIDADIPAVRPRAEPWGEEGAAEPGAFGLTLEPLPNPDHRAVDREKLLEPLPSYAARGEDVPPEAMADATASIMQWSALFGTVLDRILTLQYVQVPETLLVKRRRQGRGVEAMFRDARQAFRDAKEVRPSTLRVQAYLLKGARAVGKVDATLGLSGSTTDLLFAHWIPEEMPGGLVLPPRETEPYAAGTPGAIRVWLEGLFATLVRRGPKAVPLAPEARVLADLPPVAHAGARRALDPRETALQTLAQHLREVSYDRVFIVFASGQAAVIASDGSIEGVLRYDLEGELGNLSIAALSARVAPR